MHLEQAKCRLREPPAIPSEVASPPLNAEYTKCTANLHTAKLNLLPHMVFTALMDACRSVKANVHPAAAARAPRRRR